MKTEIIRTASLSPAQRCQAESLLDACRKEGCRLNLPFEESTCFYLFYEAEGAFAAEGDFFTAPCQAERGKASGNMDSNALRLAAVLALILPPDAPEEAAWPSSSSEDGSDRGSANSWAECAAFTRPDCRRRGFFSALLEAASDEICDVDLLFLADETDPGALAALESLQAERLSCEYKMELSLKNTDDFSQAEEAGKHCRSLSLKRAQAEDGLLYELFYETFPAAVCHPDATVLPTAASHPDAAVLPAAVSHPDATVLPTAASHPDAAVLPAALCRILPDGAAACLYDFSVRSDLRGKGIGGQALALILSDLRCQGFLSVCLHVSEDNLAAVRLYKKTGFGITETLSYYLY